MTVTGAAAKEVVQQIGRDSVQRFRNAVDEAKAVAERSRAKADLLEDRPCPEVRHPDSCFWISNPYLCDVL